NSWQGPSGISAFPIRYTDGVVSFTDNDLESDGFGVPWGRSRSWTNGTGYASPSGTNGSGMVIAEEPHLVEFSPDGSTNSIAVVFTGTTAIFFDQVGSNWQPRHYYQEQLTHNTAGQEYVLTDTVGDADPAGNMLSVISHNAAGAITEMQRSYTAGPTTPTESLLYTYLTTGENSGLLSNVTLRRQVN